MKKTKKVLWGLLMTMILMGCSIDDPEIESSEDTLKEIITQKTLFPMGGGVPDTGETPIPENEEDEEAIDPDDDNTDGTDEIGPDDNGDSIELLISNS